MLMDWCRCGGVSRDRGTDEGSGGLCRINLRLANTLNSGTAHRRVLQRTAAFLSGVDPPRHLSSLARTAPRRPFLREVAKQRASPGAVGTQIGMTAGATTKSARYRRVPSVRHAMGTCRSDRE